MLATVDVAGVHAQQAGSFLVAYLLPELFHVVLSALEECGLVNLLLLGLQHRRRSALGGRGVVTLALLGQ